MSSLLLGVTLLATTSYSYPHAWQDEIITNFDGIDHLTAFKDWQQHFDKRYEDIDEERHRFMVFLDNWKLINDHNIGGQYNYTMKMNQFGDMTYTEFLHYVHGHTESCLKHRNDAVYKVGGDMTFGSSDSEYDGVIPSALDWTNVNGSSYVTPVKDQKSCGSCWAFSAVGSLESFSAIKHGWTGSDIVQLSEQQLVDCTYRVPDGCQGGLQEDAFKYIAKHGGLCSEQEYPYKGHDGKCQDTSCGTLYDPISGYKTVERPLGTIKNERKLMEALAMGPIAVSVDAAGSGWQFYSSGVYTKKCGVSLDHGVVGVGYGHDEKGGDFWKIKNSWNTTWGEDGYMRICRNCDKNGDEGECGILRDNSYPKLS